MKQAIVGVGGTVLGVVLNNVDLRHDQNYYYYTNYYGYYHPRDTSQRDRSRVTVGAEQSGSSNGSEEY